MRLWIRTVGAAGSVAIAIFAGCGGNVFVDKDGTGGGGSGGGGTTSSTTTSTTSTTITTTTTTSITTSTTTTTSVTTTTTTNTTTGPSMCDNTGDCGDGGSGCIACAFQSMCADSYNACVGSMDCIDYSNCLNDCGNDQNCLMDCANKHPMGAQAYNDLVICVLCQACPNDCASSGGCPN